MNTCFSATVAGISLRFEADFPLEVPAEFRPFPFSGGEVQEVFSISPISQPVSFPQPPVFTSIRLNVYHTDDGIAREFPAIHDADGCKAVCVLRKSGKNSLFFPEKLLSRIQTNCTLSLLLGAEAVFLRHDCLLLHSSVVVCQGKAILFCGAPGIGKSTQAALWEQFLGAEIINGDRCVISRRASGFYGCGSPYSGSSGILSNREAPIGAIFLLGQSEDNLLRRLSPAEAFRRIFRELTVNAWDPAFMERCLSLLTQLVEDVPVYELRCRPDEAAVLLAKNEIMGK